MIKCKALEEKSLFVTAKGEILPCCFVYRGGPNLTTELREVVKEENFQGLVKSWESTEPYNICFTTCDDGQTNHPSNIQNFERQWR